GILSSMLIAPVFSLGVIRVIVGTLTLGVMMAFMLYAPLFFRPIQDLIDKYNILQAAMASSERVFKLLDTPVDIVSPAHPVKAEGRGRIEFDHVWFAYRKLEPESADGHASSISGNGAHAPVNVTPDGSDYDLILRDVSFAIEPGKNIAIVGHTGGGRPTIRSLSMRCDDVQRASLNIRGA